MKEKGTLKLLIRILNFLKVKLRTTFRRKKIILLYGNDTPTMYFLYSLLALSCHWMDPIVLSWHTDRLPTSRLVKGELCNELNKLWQVFSPLLL